ncbi:MAG: type IV pilus modification PilV family protein, partial [Gammaproteobacteria bacterium]
MKNLTPKHQKAFSIIEVMVAIVVTVVGILAIAKFQGTVLQSGSDANQRVMAVTLAERKLEEFKNQAAVPGTGYSSIVSGSDPLESVGDSQFEVKWTVDNYVYPTTKLQVAKLEPSATHPDYKQINFTISWLGLIGQQRLELSAVINSLSALSTGFGPGVGVSGEPPTVFYNPLSAPDVVPVTIESPDLKKETSKPLPDVTQKGGSTAVSFEVVTYAPYGGGLFETLRREEFLTVSCGCTTTGATGTRIEGGVVWDEDADILRDVRNVTAGQKFGTKLNSGDFSGQPFECDVCCRNKEPNPLVASGDYMQVCRLKRIDGIMTVVPDWKLVAFDLIPD